MNANPGKLTSLGKLKREPMIMNKDELSRLVIFCILMQNEEGIIGKSPGYIEEKFKSSRDTLFPENLLDEPNKKKLIEWLATWEPEEL